MYLIPMPLSVIISISQCKKDLTHLLMHWSYVFLALTPWYVTACLWSWYLHLICLWIMKAAELKRTVTGRRHSLCPNVIGDQSFGSLWRYVDSLWGSECISISLRMPWQRSFMSWCAKFWGNHLFEVGWEQTKVSIQFELWWRNISELFIICLINMIILCYTVLPKVVYWLTEPQCVSPSFLETTTWWMWHLACYPRILISLAYLFVDNEGSINLNFSIDKWLHPSIISFHTLLGMCLLIHATITDNLYWG